MKRWLIVAAILALSAIPAYATQCHCGTIPVPEPKPPTRIYMPMVFHDGHWGDLHP